MFAGEMICITADGGKDQKSRRCKYICVNVDDEVQLVEDETWGEEPCARRGPRFNHVTQQPWKSEYFSSNLIHMLQN